MDFIYGSKLLNVFENLFKTVLENYQVSVLFQTHWTFCIIEQEWSSGLSKLLKLQARFTNYKNNTAHL